jgi:hypothetical protein
MKLSRYSMWSIAALVAVIPVMGWSASPSKEAKPIPAVDLFEGIKSGEIEVAIIPKDSKEGTITVKNKTNKPLTIKMPEALAAVPVMAQLNGGGGGLAGGGGGRNSGGGGNQQNQGMGMGGGMMGGGMMGGGMGGGMMGGGMFNVAAEKMAKVKLPALCLDHGMKDPSPHVQYTLIPIESYAKSPAVAEIVKMLGRGELDQHSAQAAAWHLQNGLTWDELANKIGAKHIGGRTEPYFNVAHLQRALAATRVANERAERAPKIEPAPKTPQKSLGETLAKQE